MWDKMIDMIFTDWKNFNENRKVEGLKPISLNKFLKLF